MKEKERKVSNTDKKKNGTKMKNYFLLDCYVVHCYQCFAGTCCFHPQVRRVIQEWKTNNCVGQVKEGL
jgi:hypothetical protein